MAKLGYTWYPKDWGNSESVFELDLSERGLYRELIDLAMLNDNKVEVKKDVWQRKFAVSNTDLEAILLKLKRLNLIEINDNLLFIPSCESRLQLVRGGRQGGKNSKPISKPIVKPFESLSKKNEKPIAKQREREREREIEREKEIEDNNIDFDFKNSLLDLCSDKQLVLDWLKIRKAKKAVNTETAFDGFIREQEKSGLSVTEVLKLCVENSWRGFSSLWVENLKPKSQSTERKKYYFNFTSGGYNDHDFTEQEYEEYMRTKTNIKEVICNGRMIYKREVERD